jgi:hypothetical protein
MEEKTVHISSHLYCNMNGRTLMMSDDVSNYICALGLVLSVNF